MQILLSFNSVGYSILAGAYSTVARIYSIMLDLAGVTSEDRTMELGVIGSFSNITTAIYTIAGIFMLFRVTIAMINMLINPDMVNDGNAGAGKIITRVIASVAMLIIFIPNGWVFGDNGILSRLEKGLLAENGLITRILPSGDSTSDNTTTEGSNDSNASNDNTSTTTANQSTSAKNGKSFLVEDVLADSVKVADCYYLYKIKTNKAITTGVSKEDSAMLDNGKPGIDTDKKYVHMTIYKGQPANNNWTGRHRVCLKKGVFNKLSDCEKYYIEFEEDKDNDLNPPTGLGFTHGGDFYSDYTPDKCPRLISASLTEVPTLHQYHHAGKGTSWNDPKNYGWVAGWSSLNNLYKAAEDSRAERFGTEENRKKMAEKAPNTVDPDEARLAALYGNDSIVDERRGANLLEGVDEHAILFGQNTMGSFLQCSEGNEETCVGLIANSLKTTNGNDAVVDALESKPPIMIMDFMIGLIAAVGIAIWLVIMCVDVIIRRFKLILLQVIAPIPIISYSDPKDKMFAQWGKMYMTVYADLFLKLIAIGFATALLKGIGDTLSGKGLLVFFYIVAILVFAKVLPSLLSELFGLKLGNSFSDITGMGKAALGFGAGAAIGGAVGAATGRGLGRATGFIGGALRGAGSGTKGDLTGGAKSIAATNALKRQGLNWFDRMRYQGLGTLGIDPYLSERGALAQTEQARTQIKTLQDNIDGMDKMIERTPEVAAFSRKITNGVIQDPTGNKEKAMKEAFANAYDNAGQKTLSFADVKATKGYQDLLNTSPDAAAAFEQEYNDTYGSGASLNISGGFRAGYMTSKSAALNSLNLLRQDKETVALLKDESITGNPTGDTSKDAASILLENAYSDKTTYNDFINQIKGATYGPQGELNNLMARQSQNLSFADRKNPNKK